MAAQRVAVLRGVRIDRHAAYRIEDAGIGRGMRVPVVGAVLMMVVCVRHGR